MLIIILFGFLAYLLSKRNTFTGNFLALSLLYFLFFFLYPLTLIWSGGSFDYNGKYYLINDRLLLFSVVSAAFFIFGFVFLDFIFIISKTKRKFTDDLFGAGNFENIGKKDNPHFNWFFFVVFFASVAFLAAGLLDSTRAISKYAVRLGDAESNLLYHFWLKIASAAVISIIFCTVKATEKYRYLGLFLLLLFVAYNLTGATGRAVWLISVLLVFLYLSNIKAKTVVVGSVFALVLLTPILLRLKSIIWSISVEHSLPDFLEVYSNPYSQEQYLNNFGFSLVSLLSVDSLLEITGFRYFYDYVHGFIFYLGIFGIDVGDSLTYFNTLNITGVQKSSIPTGYLAFGYVQLGYAGVIVSGVFFRCIGYFAEYIYYKIGVESELAKFYIAYFAAATFYVGETRTLVLSFFFPMVVIFLLRPKRFLKKTDRVFD
jgi:hypothetical protein